MTQLWLPPKKPSPAVTKTAKRIGTYARELDDLEAALEYIACIIQRGANVLRMPGG